MNSEEFPPLEEQITVARDRMAPLEEKMIEAMVQPGSPLAQAAARLNQTKTISRIWSRKSRQEYAVAQRMMVRVMLRIMLHSRRDHPTSRGNLLNLVFFSQFLKIGLRLNCVKIGSFNTDALSNYARYLQDYIAKGSLDLMVPAVLTSKGCRFHTS